MKLFAITGMFVLSVALGGCLSTPNCDEPERYQAAVSGQRIQAPDGLTELEASKELVIPEASPRPARDPGAGCLDRPPSLRIGDEEDEAEEEA